MAQSKGVDINKDFKVKSLYIISFDRYCLGIHRLEADLSMQTNLTRINFVHVKLIGVKLVCVDMIKESDQVGWRSS